MKTYVGTRETLTREEAVEQLDWGPEELARVDSGQVPLPSECRIRVLEDARPERRLRHLYRHSPTGFEWGYGGSGPADAARSILGDFLGIEAPHPALYQAFKQEAIARLPRLLPDSGDAWRIGANAIERWLEANPELPREE